MKILVFSLLETINYHLIISGSKKTISSFGFDYTKYVDNISLRYFLIQLTWKLKSRAEISQKILTSVGL